MTYTERIGVWGSSYSGGHVLVLGAIDRRKGVVLGYPGRPTTGGEG
jgi:cephalosporin-C deacetylase-like acetyl esterase